MKKNSWDLDELKDTTTQLLFRGRVTALLEDKRVKDIQDKDHLVDTLSAVMKQSANEELKVQHKPRRPWISQDTLLLVENKRTAKLHRLKSAAAMMEYSELCKKVKKAARKDKRMWIQEQCAKIEQNHSDGKDSEAHKLVKQLTGGFTRTNARVIKDAQGTLLTQQDDILKRWTEYAKQLYSCLLYTSPSPRD